MFKLAVAYSAVLFTACALHAQTSSSIDTDGSNVWLPDAPTPHQNAVAQQGDVYDVKVKKGHIVSGQPSHKVSRMPGMRWMGLYDTDLGLRIQDINISYQLAHHPCGCYLEVDPISPSGKTLLPLAAFQMGMWAAVTASSEVLRHFHHPVIAALGVSADIVIETSTVQHNMHLLDIPLSQYAFDYGK